MKRRQFLEMSMLTGLGHPIPSYPRKEARKHPSAIHTSVSPWTPLTARVQNPLKPFLY